MADEGVTVRLSKDKSGNIISTAVNSGNATTGRTLRRMELDYGSIAIKLAVNPEDYTQKEPNKVAINQTKGGAWIDAWGAGIVEITIKGTTGVRGGTTDIDTGYNRWVELRNLFRELYSTITDGEEVKDLIKLYNFTDNEYWYCYPMQNGIELYRSKSRPHMYQYTINLWAIRRIGEPETKSGIIGNPLKNTNTQSSNALTTKSTTVSTSGGNTYKSREVALDSEADSKTTTNTRTKTAENIKDDCITYMNALAPIVGGYHGRISPITGYQCIQNITMQSSGMVSNVSPFTGADLSSEKTLLLAECRFTNRCSVETYEMVTKIAKYSTDVLSPEYSLIAGSTDQERVMQAVSRSKKYDSTVFELMVKYQAKSYIYRNEVNHLKMLLLEGMMIYCELWRIYNQPNESMSTTLTIPNMNTFINNLRAMIMYFDYKSAEASKFYTQDISIQLRYMEKAVTQIITDVIDYL